MTYLSRNTKPYNGRKYAFAEECERVVRALCSFAAEQGAEGKLTTVAIGGIDRTHVQACEKQVRHLLRKLARESTTGLFAGRYRKPAFMRLGFAMTENRIK